MGEKPICPTRINVWKKSFLREILKGISKFSNSESINDNIYKHKINDYEKRINSIASRYNKNTTTTIDNNNNNKHKVAYEREKNSH